MIVCPNCSHQNPDSATQCEACYTPLPVLSTCPSCGASVQADASFCGQCGFDLRSPAPVTTPVTTPGGGAEMDPLSTYTPEEAAIPPLNLPEPLVAPEPLPDLPVATPDPDPEPTPDPEPVAVEPEPATTTPIAPSPLKAVGLDQPDHPQVPEQFSDPDEITAMGATQLQVNQAKLVHIQTDNIIELSPQLTLVRIGKPNDRVPPDIDVSGFPNSEIVSRAHAQLRVEGDTYYIEDVGSSNGTYINNMPLPYGNRHRLRPGDRIALGKGDKVSFIFQSPE